MVDRVTVTGSVVVPLGDRLAAPVVTIALPGVTGYGYKLKRLTAFATYADAADKYHKVGVGVYLNDTVITNATLCRSDLMAFATLDPTLVRSMDMDQPDSLNAVVRDEIITPDTLFAQGCGMEPLTGAVTVHFALAADLVKLSQADRGAYFEARSI